VEGVKTMEEDKSVGQLRPKMTIEEFLESPFLTERGLGRCPKTAIEKILSSRNTGQFFPQVFVYRDGKMSESAFRDIPVGVNIIQRPSFEQSYIEVPSK